jgi:hypothetical protein
MIDQDNVITIRMDDSGVAAGTKAAKQHLDRFEQQVLQHARRLREINTRHSNQLEIIEAKRLAAVSQMREKAFIQEQALLRRREQSYQKTATSISSSFKSIATVGVALAAAGLASLAKQATDSYREYDKLIQSLKQSEGTIDRASKKYQQLFTLGQRSVGLTGRDLVEGYSFLKNSLNGSAEASERLAVSFGRVKALFADFDARRAAGNIRQIVSERFQIQDVREMENQAPGFTRGLFNEFNVKNIEQLRKAVADLNPTMSELENRLANVFDKLGAKSDNFTTRLAKIGAQFQESLVPLGNWISDTGMKVFDALAPGVTDMWGRVTKFFSDIGPGLQQWIVSAAKFWGEMLTGISRLEERFGVFDKMGWLFNRVSGAASTVIGTVTGIARGLRDALSVALDWVATKLDTILAATQGLLSNVSKIPGFGAIGTGAGDVVHNARVMLQGMKSQSAPPAINDPVVRSSVNSEESRYNDFGGGGSGKSGKSSSQKAVKDLLSAAYVQRRDVSIDRKAIEDAQERRMDFFVDEYRAGQERMRDQRASRVELTKDFAEKEAKAIEDQRKALEKLEPVLSNTQRFMAGLRADTDALGNAFERFGDSVGAAFGDVRNLFDGLKSAIKSFFQDITGNVLRNVAGAALSPLMAIGGGARGGGSFFTGGFAGGPGAGSYIQQSQMSSIINSVMGGGSVGSAGGGWIGSSVPTTAGKVGILGGIKSSLGNIFGGNSIAAPLLGGMFGSMLGGQSRAGNVLGAAGGILTSTFLSTTLGAPGALGSLAPALFSNPITAIAGAGLLVGSILLGRAKQRKADEKVVDTYWVEYSRVLKELTGGVRNDSIMGDDALRQAAEARETAVGLIGQIKTKSVRESRLKNQIPQIDAHDLRNLQNAVAEQRTRLTDNELAMKRRSDLDSRLVAEFSSGGVINGAYGSRQALIGHAGEVILNARQRAAVGDDELAAAGVPGIRGGAGGAGNLPPINIQYIAGTKEQTEVVINGLKSPNASRAFQEKLSTVLRYGA